MSYKLRALGFISSFAVFSPLAAAQTILVTYATAPVVASAPPEVIPVLGTAGLLVLSILLLVYGAFWLRKNPKSIKFTATIIATGLLASASSVGWLVENAQAVIATTTYLTSENPSPIAITSYPAVLENDFDVSISVSGIEVTGCPLGNTISGTCENGSVIPGGESCTFDDVVCDAAGPTGTFTGCVDSWCLQEGTLGQYTQCESVSPDGLTCYNPEIRYGSVEGGIPTQHGGNRYDEWCQQLGFASDNGVTLGTRSAASPNGHVFGCTAYDESTWHWCDWQDGDWLDESLDYHSPGTGNEITSFSCAGAIE